MVADPVLCVTVPCHGCDIDAVIRVCSPWCPQSVILKHPQPHLKGQEEPQSIPMLSHPVDMLLGTTCGCISWLQ